MADQTATNQTPAVEAPQAPPPESLHPSQINIRDYKDKAQKDKASEILQAWYDKVSEDVRRLLTDHGVKTYELCFKQEGSRASLLATSGDLFQTAKLAASASRHLKKQVNDELSDEVD